MPKLFECLLRRRTEDGASAVEYGLLVAAVAAAVAMIVFALGDLIVPMFKHTCDDMNAGDFVHTAATC